MSTTTAQVDQQIAGMDAEQLPVSKYDLHGPKHFAGLYAAEHVAGTEFVFGATFVILGAGIWDILIGLLIGNILAVLSFWLITTPIATSTRLSLYTYLQKIGGAAVSRLYNAANALIFAVISAAMITVSATAVRRLVGFPAQTEAYPTHWGFVLLAVAFSAVAILVAAFGFTALAEFATICGPWLMVMFTTGGLVLLPAVAESVTGFTTIPSWNDFVQISGATVFTGETPDGTPGIGLWEVAGFAWAANTFVHFGLIDMALLRYAKKNWYGTMTSTGMLFGHYVAWISAGFMGAATAAITLTSVTVLAPGDVAWYALGYAGIITVIVGGWTTANSNLYRAGLAGQAVFPQLSRVRVTLIMGLLVVVASVFPFVYRNFLPLVTYAGVILVPIGGIIFAEHYLFKRFGLTKFWATYKDVKNVPAMLTWAIVLVFAAAMVFFDVMPYSFVFVPTWSLSIVVYLLLAKRSAATEKYPEAEAADKLFAERVEVFHERQAAATPNVSTKDTSAFSRALRIVWIVALIVILVDAFVVLFASPDMYSYLVKREQFYTIAFVGTILYFATAYWELRRNKSVAARRFAETAQAHNGDGPGPGGATVASAQTT